MKKLLLWLLVLILIGGIVGAFLYNAIFSSNVNLDGRKEVIFYIPSGSDIRVVKDSLLQNGHLLDEASFDKVASLMKYTNVKPGRYLIKDGWSNKELISALRSGKQKPVNLTFNNLRTIEDVAGFFSQRLEPDSLTLLKHFTSETVLSETKTSKADVMTFFIPNTYQFYWNSSPAKIFDRMVYEHENFFGKKRKEKLKALDLSASEVYTLASIVQKETLVGEEKPRVAGVYINRLRRGQLLQADPTVVFASGDFGLRRVLNKHLAIDSPYNTYKYPGLPPGPIAMPDVSTIDAVLNYEKHRYLYFCASPDNSGRHLFAKTLVEHNRNADRYRTYLNKSRIFK